MQVLVIGSGGREHALAWKAAQSNQVRSVYVAPGNAGTAMETNVINVPINADDIEALLTFAQKEQIDLTIVGPEAPLVAGIVDRFQESGLRIFGPTAAAAQLEGSKAFTKDFLVRHNIPTAAYRTFTALNDALEYIEGISLPIVIKADGLAAGKGVIIAGTHDQAVAAVADMLAGNKFGDAGHRVVIEEFMSGEEASFICMVDGVNIVPMASSQDHKARDDGDTGPNTGGMGAYSPAPIVDNAMHARIMDSIIRPTVDGMRADGHPFCGFLYAGLMIGDDGVPRVVEFNARFGDPEAQPIMMRLQGDLVELCVAACDGRVDQASLDWDSRTAVGVVMAAGGYPDDYEKGSPIRGLDNVGNNVTKVFHAGTAKSGTGEVVTNGGRVLCVVGLGESVYLAQQTAYAGVDKIQWKDAYCRRDIAHRAVSRS